MNAKTIEGLTMIKDGIDLILASQQESTKEVAAPAEKTAEETKVKKSVKKTPAIPAKEESTEDYSEPNGEATVITAESLKTLCYNEIKKLAASMGLSAKGARPEIEERILNADTTAPTEETPAEAPEEKKEVKKTAKKLGKKSEPAPDPEEEEVDEVTQKVMDVTADMETEEIADFLTECGISAKGKREALIAKLVKAVKNGDIELDDDEEESEEESDDSAPAEESTTDKSEDSESEDDDEVEEEDNTNDLNNPDMTKERKKAIKEYTSEVESSVKSKEISREDMVEFLQGFYDDDDDYSEYSDDEVTDLYIDAACRMIDDEGNFVEDEGTPYTVNGENYCCGSPLSFDEDGNKYICEKCGTEYEAE